MRRIRRITLVIRPALVPIRAPRLALARATASEASVESSPWLKKKSIAGSISVIKESVEIRSSQKKNELKYSGLAKEAKTISTKKQNMEKEVRMVKVTSAPFGKTSNLISSPRRAKIVIAVTNI